MKLDLGSFAFGSEITTGGGTPSWGTSLGQKRPDLKLTYPGYDNIVIGMMYKSVPTDKVFMPIGKGGHVCSSLEDDGLQLAALFDKVYINEVRVNAPFILVIYKDSSDSWNGRRTLKYNVKTEYRRTSIDVISNLDFQEAAEEALQLENGACWVISDVFIVNQDELHFVAGIVNPHHSESYATSEQRKTAFLEAINTTYEENPHFSKKYSDESLQDVSTSKPEIDDPLQQIFYGAPGTGKSYTVEEVCKHYKHRRTTFHPDSDYSTFVGCYKPKSKRVEPINNKSQLIDKLSVIKNSGVTYPCHKFAAKYWDSLKDLSTNDIKDILVACGFTESMNVEISKGIAIGEDISRDCKNTSITYEFVPQAFTNAYIDAWQNPTEPVFLVIEEINRGNCAQIFGDLFQLLDRDDKTGYSKYEITPDTDLQEYISKQGLEISEVLDSDDNDISAQIASGELMKLPNNLYIWATMNTSDQSLFPIDSAFKRRWDWKYVPINTAKENWAIKVAGELFSWTSFLNRINEEIDAKMSSEDKKLGFYFCKAEEKTNDSYKDNNLISVERFVSKVLFYIYNDVFKDYGLDSEFFKHQEGEKKGKTIYFKDFYEMDGKVKQAAVKELLLNLKVDPFRDEYGEEQEDGEEDGDGPSKRGKHKYLTEIIFPDETLSSYDLTRDEMFVKALKKIGFEKAIEALSTKPYPFKRLGCPLISKEKFPEIDNSSKYKYITEDGYYIISGMSDNTKISALETLKIKYRVDVQIVFRNQGDSDNH